MNEKMADLIQVPGRRSGHWSRRGVLVRGTIAGVASTLGLSVLTRPSQAAMGSATGDAEILNKALYYEHQAVWAYGVAAGKLSDTSVGRAVKALALKNQADHKAHGEALTAAIRQLGATPVAEANSYDVSPYIQRGEGNLDSDINIAKLALALETDAAIAYVSEIANLKTPALITAGASIGTDEAAHATAIRAAFVSLGVEMPIVPASFISADTRSNWVLKV